MEDNKDKEMEEEQVDKRSGWVDNETMILDYIHRARPSIFISHVKESYASEEKIKKIIETLNLGEIEGMYIGPFRKKDPTEMFQYSNITVFFRLWYNNQNAKNMRVSLMQGKKVKIPYTEKNSWIVVANKNINERFDATIASKNAIRHFARNPIIGKSKTTTRQEKKTKTREKTREMQEKKTKTRETTQEQVKKMQDKKVENMFAALCNDNEDKDAMCFNDDVFICPDSPPYSSCPPAN